VDIQGLHILIALGKLIIGLYLAHVIFYIILNNTAPNHNIKVLFDLKKHRKVHIAAVIISIILLSTSVKLEVQSDEAREYHRHTFDTKVYESDREFQKGSDQRYNKEKMLKEENKSKQQWDEVQSKQQQKGI